jgi:hypothetical protein
MRLGVRIWLTWQSDNFHRHLAVPQLANFMNRLNPLARFGLILFRLGAARAAHISGAVRLKLRYQRG